MTRLTTALAVLSLASITACQPIETPNPYSPVTTEAGNRLEEGRWSFSLSEINMEGDCADAAESIEEEIQLRGTIFYIQGRHLEVEIEGLLLSGAQDGTEIYADGGEGYAVDYTDDEPVSDDEVPREDGDDSDEDCAEEGEASCGEGYGGGYGGNGGYESELFVSLEGLIDSPTELNGMLFIDQIIPGGGCLIRSRYTASHSGNAQAPNGSSGSGSGGTEPSSEGE